MNKLNNLNKLNESLYGELSRLNPVRYKNDVKAANLFDEIKKDFIKNNKDLRKVSILKHKSSNKLFNDGKLSIGRFDKITYLFDKFHPVYNNNYTGNNFPGKREIVISFIPFEITFKRNKLEMMFNSPIFNKLKINVTDTRWEKNPIYNPNISSNLNWNESPSPKEREMMVKLNVTEDEYKISPDIGGKIIKYFIKEYNKQYPELINSKYLGNLQISDINKNVKPTIKHIEFKNKYGDFVYCAIRYGDDETKIRKLLYNMKKEEVDKYCKEKREKLYADSRKRSETIVNNFKKKVTDLLYDYNDKLKELDIRHYEDHSMITLVFNKKYNDYFNKEEEKIIQLLLQSDSNYTKYYVRNSNYKETYFKEIILKTDDYDYFTNH
jgi:hypothetical protein